MHKLSQSDISGFIGKRVRISEIFKATNNPKLCTVMEGKVFGAFVTNYKNESFIRTTICFLFGEIPSRDVLHYNTHQEIYTKSENGIIPFQEISFVNDRISEIFERFRIEILE